MILKITIIVLFCFVLFSEAIASFHNVEFELSTSPFIMGLSTQEPRNRDHINLSKILKLGFL